MGQELIGVSLLTENDEELVSIVNAKCLDLAGSEYILSIRNKHDAQV